MSCFCILILTKYSPYVKNACYLVFHYSLPSHNTYIFLTEAAAASVNIVPKSWMLLLFFPIPHDEERCHHQYQHHTLIVLAEFTKQNRRRKPVPPIGNCAVVGYNFVYVPAELKLVWGGVAGKANHLRDHSIACLPFNMRVAGLSKFHVSTYARFRQWVLISGMHTFPTNRSRGLNGEMRYVYSSILLRTIIIIR